MGLAHLMRSLIIGYFAMIAISNRTRGQVHPCFHHLGVDNLQNNPANPTR